MPDGAARSAATPWRQRNGLGFAAPGSVLDLDLGLVVNFVALWQTIY